MLYQVYALESNIKDYLEGHPWLDISDINIIVPNLITLVLIIAVVVFFFLILMGGIQWITAGGDKEAMANAQKRLTSALIGMVIVFSAWAILNLVKYFFGLTPATPPTPSGVSDRRPLRNRSAFMLSTIYLYRRGLYSERPLEQQLDRFSFKLYN